MKMKQLFKCSGRLVVSMYIGWEVVSFVVHSVPSGLTAGGCVPFQGRIILRTFSQSS